MRWQLSATCTFFKTLKYFLRSEIDTATELRKFTDGLMASSFTETEKELLPKLDLNGDGVPEYTAGDVRAMENPALACLHTLFLREHNRIAREMKLLQPMMDDEAIYQQTRRIVIAEWQNVVFGQFLAAMLGQDTTERMDLHPACPLSTNQS